MGVEANDEPLSSQPLMSPCLHNPELILLLLCYQSLDQTNNQRREIDLLPEEVLMEILVRLPILCLFRFRCVSKAWCSLIKSPRFVDLHLSRQEDVILVKRLFRDEWKTILSFHSSDECLSLQAVAPDFEVPYSGDSTLFLVGTSNGIICLRNYKNDDIYLYNPATCEFLTLPHRPFGRPRWWRSTMVDSGFGFDPASDNYKILIITKNSPSNFLAYDHVLYKADICSLSTNSWREPDTNVALFSLQCSVSFNGCFHSCNGLIDDRLDDGFGFKILSFDMSTEEFREIQYPDGMGKVYPFPDYGAKQMHRLIRLENSLAIICCTDPDKEISDQHIDIWVMMEHGVQESWVKKFSIGPLSAIQRPLSSWNNDKLLLGMCNGQVASCALLGDNHGRVTKYNVHNVRGFPISLEADIYRRRLVSLYERCGG